MNKKNTGKSTHSDYLSDNVYKFPSQHYQDGVEKDNKKDTRPRLFRCSDCGNTRLFFASLEVNVNAEVSMVDSFFYDFNDMSIERVEEDFTGLICAECNSNNVKTYYLDVDYDSVSLISTDGTRHLLKEDME